jgi:hypothetical protein
MTKLEELKAAHESAYGDACDAAWAAYDAAYAAYEAARSARNVAWVAYRAELKKQQENSNG